MSKDERIWWARQWFRYLKLNENYAEYCTAITNKSRTVIKRLHKEFELIEQLYSDWGNIYEVNIFDTRNKIFRKWYELNKHLFEEQLSSITTISTAKDIKADTLNLSINLYATKAKTQKQVKDYIDNYYSKHTVKNNNPPYQLYAPSNRLVLQTKQLVEKASNAYHLNKMLVDDKKLTNAEQVAYIYEAMHSKTTHSRKQQYSTTKTAYVARTAINENIWQWHWDATDRGEYKKTIAKDKKPSKIAFGNKISELQRFRRSHSNIVKNTIYGIFPKHT